MPRGGLRTNPGGRPKGTTGIKHKATISKEQAREALRTLVMQHLEPLVRAQLHHAKGISHMMLRQKDGTFKRSENADEIEQALNSGDKNSYYVFTKDPSVQAFTDLMNRALDKPKEQEQEHHIQGKFVVKWSE